MVLTFCSFLENRTPPPADLDVSEPFPSPEPSSRPKRSLQQIMDDVDALLQRGDSSPPPAGVSWNSQLYLTKALFSSAKIWKYLIQAARKRLRQDNVPRSTSATDEQQRVLDAITILRAARKEAELESAALFGHASSGRKDFLEPVVFQRPPRTTSFLSFRNPYTKKNMYLMLKADIGIRSVVQVGNPWRTLMLLADLDLCCEIWQNILFALILKPIDVAVH